MARRAKGEGSWFKMGNGTWRLRVSYEGIGVKTFYGAEKALCTAKKEEFEALLKKGFDVKNDAPTFDIFARAWLKNVKMVQLKVGSYDRLETTFERHLIPVIQDTPLNKIDDFIIQSEIINKMQDAGLSYSTIKKAYDGLNSLFKYAISKKKMIENPMDLVEMPNKSMFETKDIIYWSKDERNRFIDACKSTYTNGNRRYSFSGLFIFCLKTGCRIGEALSLKHNEIDYKNHTALIDSTIVMTKDRKNGRSLLLDQQSTKRNGSRIIYLPDDALAAIDDAKEQLGWTPDGYIFHTQKNGPINIATAQKSFYALLSVAGLEKCGTHTMRHTFVSLALQNNVPLVAIADQIGHANPGITSRIYSHLLKEAKMASMDVFNKMA